MKMLACVSCPEGADRHRQPYTHEGAQAMSDHLVDVHGVSPRPTLPWALMKVSEVSTPDKLERLPAVDLASMVDYLARTLELRSGISCEHWVGDALRNRENRPWPRR